MAHPSLKLVVTKGPMKGQELLLEPGRWTLGRDERAHLRLGGDDAISRTHAKIHVSKRGAVFHNRSPNGTWINRQRSKKARLASGDRLEVGESYELRVEETRRDSVAKESGEPATVAKPSSYLGIPRRYWLLIGSANLLPIIVVGLWWLWPETKVVFISLEEAKAAAPAEVAVLLDRAAVYEQRLWWSSAKAEYEKILSREKFDANSKTTRYALERLAALERRR